MSDLELVVGRIGKPHGLRGEVSVVVRTDEPDDRFAEGAVLHAGPPRAGGEGADPVPEVLTVTGRRWHQGRLLVTFAEVPDRNAAEAARGTVLHVRLPPDASPEDPDEFYAHQLVGLEVHDEQGVRLGEVVRLVPGAAQDLLAVRTEDGREALVPFVAALVPEVDLAGGRIVVADRPGLVAPYPDEG